MHYAFLPLLSRNRLTINFTSAMKAIFLIKTGKPETAFEAREIPVPVPEENQVLIKTEASGLNFADVMARLGMYKDAPPIPCILGYELVGRIEKIGKGVRNLIAGQRVLTFTRFGAYAEYVVADYRGVVPIPQDMDAGVACALATQYCTAWYAAEEMVKLNEGDHVLVNAAAGGVGIALVQIAKRKKCIVYGTCGSDEKIEFLKKSGVDFPINYLKQDFYEAIRNIRGKQGLDVVFDSVGGSNFKKGKNLLGHGGRIVGYGAAERVGGSSFFSTLSLAWNFGFFSPITLIMKSQAIIGVNMLRIAETKPEILQRCIQQVLTLTMQGELKPHVGGIFPAERISEAHAFLESRKSIGKIIVSWDNN